MSGADVKREVMEALEAGGGIGVADDDAIAALSTCVVLTAEERDEVAEAIDWARGGNYEWLDAALALLTPQEKP